MKALDGRVHHAAVEAGYPAQHDAQDQAERYADQSDGQRYAAGDHQPRKQVAAVGVGAEQEQALLGRLLHRAEQMAVGAEDPEQPVLVAAGEQPHADLAVRNRREHGPERGVPPVLELQYVRAETPFVEQPDALRRDELPERLGIVGVGVGDEIGEDRHQIEAADQHGGDHRSLVAQEADAHEPPLRVQCLLRLARARAVARRDRVFRCRCHQRAPTRMRGSIHNRTISDRKVPITVSMLTSSRMLPASSMSCRSSA